MSIHLEALRKSEKNQHAREAPTIHSDDQTTAVSEPLRTGPLALLLIATLFLIGWFIWRQYQPPAGSYGPPVTLEADGAQAVSGPLENKKQPDQQPAKKPDFQRSLPKPAWPHHVRSHQVEKQLQKPAFWQLKNHPPHQYTLYSMFSSTYSCEYC